MKEYQVSYLLGGKEEYFKVYEVSLTAAVYAALQELKTVEFDRVEGICIVLIT